MELVIVSCTESIEIIADNDSWNKLRQRWRFFVSLEPSAGVFTWPVSSSMFVQRSWNLRETLPRRFAICFNVGTVNWQWTLSFPKPGRWKAATVCLACPRSRGRKTRSSASFQGTFSWRSEMMRSWTTPEVASGHLFWDHWKLVGRLFRSSTSTWAMWLWGPVAFEAQCEPDQCAVFGSVKWLLDVSWCFQMFPPWCLLLYWQLRSFHTSIRPWCRRSNSQKADVGCPEQGCRCIDTKTSLMTLFILFIYNVTDRCFKMC